jgi:hypothetical protein
MLSLDSVLFSHLIVNRLLPDAAGQHCLKAKWQVSREALMAGMRNDRAHARARDLLATLYPIPDDAEFHRLRELAIAYIREAERIEAETSGRAPKRDEVITAALDAIARDYFTRALMRVASRKVP